MLSAVARLARRAFAAAPSVIDHPKLGPLSFDAHRQEWASVPDMEVAFGGIPGTRRGPSPAAVDLLLDRMSAFDRYWHACEADLRHVLVEARVLPEDDSRTPRDVLRIAAVMLYGDAWEASFETLPGLPWLFASMRFEGDRYVPTA